MQSFCFYLPPQSRDITTVRCKHQVHQGLVLTDVKANVTASGFLLISKPLQLVLNLPDHQVFFWGRVSSQSASRCRNCGSWSKTPGPNESKVCDDKEWRDQEKWVELRCLITSQKWMPRMLFPRRSKGGDQHIIPITLGTTSRTAPEMPDLAGRPTWPRGGNTNVSRNHQDQQTDLWCPGLVSHMECKLSGEIIHATGVHEAQGVSNGLCAQDTLVCDWTNTSVGQRGGHDASWLAGHLDGAQLEGRIQNKACQSSVAPPMEVFLWVYCLHYRHLDKDEVLSPPNYQSHPSLWPLYNSVRKILSVKSISLFCLLDSNIKYFTIQ